MTGRFRKGAGVLVLALCLGGCGSRTGDRDERFQLTILHTNDVHSFLAGSNNTGPCYSEDCPGGRGGYARMAGLIAEAKKTDSDTLLLDAGDQFQGTLFYARYKGKASAEYMNLLGYTAMTPGNHEFDDGCETLVAFARELHFPMVAANLDPGACVPAAEAYRFRPWIVVEKRGRKIGIVGLVTPEVGTLTLAAPGARFSEPADSLRRAVAELRGQGVDIVLALTHLGLDKDRLLARSVDGVDVIVGGHTHTLLSNSDPRAVGPYPVVERSPSGEPVLIVTAKSYAHFLGRLQVAFDGRGVVRSWSGDALPVSADLPRDARVAELDRKYAAELSEVLGQPLGSIQAAGLEPGQPLEVVGSDVCRKAECASGNVIVEALLAGAEPRGARIALLNSGCVRLPLLSGDVSLGRLLAVLPYENEIMLGDVPGATLLEALEHGLRRVSTGGGEFLQVAGLRYRFDPSRPEGQRLTGAWTPDTTGGWEPVRKERIYRVAVPEYLARGGDSYAMLAALAWKGTGLKDRDAVRRALETRSPLRVKLDGRITAGK